MPVHEAPKLRKEIGIGEEAMRYEEFYGY